jgi:hypothetical protein
MKKSSHHFNLHSFPYYNIVITKIVYEGSGTLNLAVEDDDGGEISVNVDLK